MSRPGVIYEENPDTCQLCGKYAELRPYGPKGENICFECGMKDEKNTKLKFREYVLGEKNPQ